MMAFLKDPTTAPDSTCLQSNKFDFFIPYNGKPPVNVAAITDKSLGLQGVVPVGWKKAVLSSTYFRRAYLFDPTLVDLETLALSQDSALAAITNHFEGSHLDQTPLRSATRTINGLAWSIYESKFNGEPVLIGLAQIGGNRNIALTMVVSAPERDAFYKGLFIPMLDSLIPLQ
jgi:hypothetical protein